jgi:hypothetical protein
MRDAILHCPVCGAEKRENKRYPRYLCRACAAKVEDESGRRLEITNANSEDGIRVAYADTGEERISRECFVQGIRCWAREAHMGGVVVQAYDDAGKTA